jgi:HSP20 family molecular chaperone IbpA
MSKYWDSFPMTDEEVKSHLDDFKKEFEDFKSSKLYTSSKKDIFGIVDLIQKLGDDFLNDSYEENKDFISHKVELPGYAKEDITVSINKDKNLEIKNINKDKKPKVIFLRLPETTESIDVSMDLGLMTIKIMKKPEKKEILISFKI